MLMAGRDGGVAKQGRPAAGWSGVLSQRFPAGVESCAMWFSVRDVLDLLLVGRLLPVFHEPAGAAPSPGGNGKSEATPAPEPMLEESEPVAPFSEWWPEPPPAVGGRLDADIPTGVRDNSIAGVVVESRSGHRFVNLRIDDQMAG